MYASHTKSLNSSRERFDWRGHDEFVVKSCSEILCFVFSVTKRWWESFNACKELDYL